MKVIIYSVGILNKQHSVLLIGEIDNINDNKIKIIDTVSILVEREGLKYDIPELIFGTRRNAFIEDAFVSIQRNSIFFGRVYEVTDEQLDSLKNIIEEYTNSIKEYNIRFSLRRFNCHTFVCAIMARIGIYDEVMAKKTFPFYNGLNGRVKSYVEQQKNLVRLYRGDDIEEELIKLHRKISNFIKNDYILDSDSENDDIYTNKLDSLSSQLREFSLFITDSYVRRSMYRETPDDGLNILWGNKQIQQAKFRYPNTYINIAKKSIDSCIIKRNIVSQGTLVFELSKVRNINHIMVKIAINILKDYASSTRNLLKGHWNRHHVKLVKRTIIPELEQWKIEFTRFNIRTDNLFAEKFHKLISNLPLDLRVNGSLFKRIMFICYIASNK